LHGTSEGELVASACPRRFRPGPGDTLPSPVAHVGRRRLRLDDDQRRRLAVLGQRLGRGLLREFATLVKPDTILRWHRELVARKWEHSDSTGGLILRSTRTTLM
jgi:hypothetical protein